MYQADANKRTLKRAFQSTLQGDIINWFFWHQFPLLMVRWSLLVFWLETGFGFQALFFVTFPSFHWRIVSYLASFPKTMFQNEAKCESFDMKMFFILVQLKLIFTWTVLHSAPFWKWEFLELGYGLIGYGSKFSLSETRRVSLSQMVYYLQLYPSFDENIRKESYTRCRIK